MSEARKIYVDLSFKKLQEFLEAAEISFAESAVMINHGTIKNLTPYMKKINSAYANAKNSLNLTKELLRKERITSLMLDLATLETNPDTDEQNIKIPLNLQANKSIEKTWEELSSALAKKKEEHRIGNIDFNEFFDKTESYTTEFDEESNQVILNLPSYPREYFWKFTTKANSLLKSIKKKYNFTWVHSQGSSLIFDLKKNSNADDKPYDIEITWNQTISQLRAVKNQVHPLSAFNSKYKKMPSYIQKMEMSDDELEKNIKPSLNKPFIDDEGKPLVFLVQEKEEAERFNRFLNARSDKEKDVTYAWRPEDKVIIAETPDVGNKQVGVFAGKNFDKQDVIIEEYMGDVLFADIEDADVLEDKILESDDTTGDYLLQVYLENGKGLAIDGEYNRGAASFCNQAEKINADFKHNPKTGKIEVLARRRIRFGEEVVVSYAHEKDTYWDEDHPYIPRKPSSLKEVFKKILTSLHLNDSADVKSMEDVQKLLKKINQASNKSQKGDSSMKTRVRIPSTQTYFDDKGNLLIFDLSKSDDIERLRNKKEMTELKCTSKKKLFVAAGAGNQGPLFLMTGEALKPGDIICKIDGEWISDPDSSAYDENSSYIFETPQGAFCYTKLIGSEVNLLEGAPKASMANVKLSSDGITIISTKNIKPGEPLFINYGEYKNKHKCSSLQEIIAKINADDSLSFTLEFNQGKLTRIDRHQTAIETMNVSSDDEAIHNERELIDKGKSIAFSQYSGSLFSNSFELNQHLVDRVENNEIIKTPGHQYIDQVNDQTSKGTTPVNKISSLSDENDEEIIMPGSQWVNYESIFNNHEEWSIFAESEEKRGNYQTAEFARKKADELLNSKGSPKYSAFFQPGNETNSHDVENHAKRPKKGR